jgi:hypothetical protein
MGIEWTRERNRTAPWVGDGGACTYRIYPTHEFAIVRATVQLRGRAAEHPLGVFPTLDAATRHVNAHYQQAALHARDRALARLRAEKEHPHERSDASRGSRVEGEQSAPAPR